MQYKRKTYKEKPKGFFCLLGTCFVKWKTNPNYYPNFHINECGFNAAVNKMFEELKIYMKGIEQPL